MVVSHPNVSARETLGTKSTARLTANTHTARAASTITTQLFIDRGSPTSSFPPAATFGQALVPRGAGRWGWVAGPGLEGGQVAVLRLHVASSYHVTAAAYSYERGERITQLHRFFLAQ